ncbi:hypothetical protein TWF281_000131 [Arthrobotrys megalospora]
MSTMPPASGSTVKSTARGFEVLLMPFDASKYMAATKTYVLGDTSADYGHKSVFLTLEIAPGEGNDSSSLWVTFPLNKSAVGRLKFTPLDGSLIYYKLGVGDKEPDLLWFLAASLPKLEQKSKARNASWRSVNIKVDADNEQKCNAFYLRTAIGRRINPDFFTKCQLGNLKCSDLGDDGESGRAFDHKGNLKSVLLANQLLMGADTDALLEALKNSPPQELEDNHSPAQPLQENIREQSPAPHPESHGGEIPTATPPIHTRTASPMSEASVPVTLTLGPKLEPEPEPGPKAPAARSVSLDDDPGCTNWPLLHPPPGLFKTPGYRIVDYEEEIIGSIRMSFYLEEPDVPSGNLIDFEGFGGLGNFEKRSWVGILHEELLPKDQEKRGSNSKSDWLEILKQEFKEG